MRSVQDIPLIGIGMGLIVVVGLIAGVGGIVISDDRPPIGQAPPINDTTTAEGMTQSQSESVNEPPQTYAVTAQSATAIDTQQLAEYGEVGTQADDRIELRMPPSDVSAVQNIAWVANVRPVIRPEPAQTGTDIPGSSEGVGEDGSLGVQQAHQNGITGEDVEVGIIDSGFDTDNPAIASNVVETRSFRSSPGDPAHGTSVAEVVTRTAPDSQLSLVSSENGIDTEAAINYLKGQDVDIIVHSAGFPAFEDDGDHILTDEINAATGSGILFVNSAGNYAQTHWEGQFRDADGDDLHEWTQSGDERNCLPNCDREFSGDVTVYVRWTDQGAESHYRASLFNPETDEYISFDDDGVFTTASGIKYTVLSVDNIQSQPVDLTVDHISGPANDEIEVTVIEGPEEIQRNIPASSIIPPADVPAAMAVAAYQVGPRQLAPYSSRGPTDDGRTGIDVTGYTNILVENELYGSDEFVFTGTSAAAPYVGGVAALVEENQAGDQSPTELTSTLKSASDDILDPGTDTASGSGVVNAADAGGVPETPPSVEVDVDPTDLSGDGSESNPYEISNVSELQAMEDDLDANYELVSDIDASQTAQFNDGTGFDPVGPSFSAQFAGSLDGSNHTITGLTIDRPTENRIGVIGVLANEGTIRNVSIVDADITGNFYTGGIVGTTDGEVVSSSVTGTVTSSNNNAGGLAGSNDGLLRESSAQVIVTGENQVGGLVGLNSDTIRKSSATGSVSASGTRVGGLVATNNNNATVENSYATGAVTGDSKVGGLVGLNPGIIERAFAVGSVSGTSAVGGLVGTNTASFAETPGIVENSYFDELTTGQSTSAGSATGLTTAEMQGQAAAENMALAFGETWQTVSGDYPELIALADSDSDSDSDSESESGSPTIVDEFDTDGNGEISIIELGQAGQAFASGEISITELGEVGAAFAS